MWNTVCIYLYRNTIFTDTITSELEYKSNEIRFSLCWITKAKVKDNLLDLNLFRKCGLLLWLVRMIITKANAKEN